MQYIFYNNAKPFHFKCLDNKRQYLGIKLQMKGMIEKVKGPNEYYCHSIPALIVFNWNNNSESYVAQFPVLK